MDQYSGMQLQTDRVCPECGRLLPFAGDLCLCNNFVCNVCKRKFTSLKRLENHNCFVCADCSRPFYNSSHYNRHVKVGCKKFCQMCKVFVKPIDFQDHERQHFETSEPTTLTKDILRWFTDVKSARKYLDELRQTIGFEFAQHSAVTSAGGLRTYYYKCNRAMPRLAKVQPAGATPENIKDNLPVRRLIRKKSACTATARISSGLTPSDGSNKTVKLEINNRHDHLSYTPRATSNCFQKAKSRSQHSQSHHYESSDDHPSPSTNSVVNRPVEDEHPIFNFSEPHIQKTNREKFYEAASMIAKYAQRLMAVDSEPTDEQVQTLEREAASIAQTADNFFATEVPRERLSKRRKIDNRQI